MIYLFHHVFKNNIPSNLPEQLDQWSRDKMKTGNKVDQVLLAKLSQVQLSFLPMPRKEIQSLMHKKNFPVKAKVQYLQKNTFPHVSLQFFHC